MKRMILLLIGFLLMVAGAASGKQVTLSPTGFAILSDPGDGDGEVVLLQFSLPPEVAAGRIVRATLWHDVDCSSNDGVSVWAHPAPSSWDPVTIDRSWWMENKAQIDERKVAFFDSPVCSEAGAHYEVSRWARAWAASEATNLGIVLRRPPGEIRSFILGSSGDFPTPVLRISYRRRPTE
jgi:hypothetical protein